MELQPTSTAPSASMPLMTPKRSSSRAVARRDAAPLVRSTPTVPASASPAGMPEADTRERSELLSRALHVGVASAALLALSPLLLAVALAVKITSPGPVFYTQTRIGLDRRWRRGAAARYDRRGRDLGGAAFTIYKFRTMRVDSETRSGAVWAAKNDPRVTPIGKFLRKSRIDEIPQLFNVIKGDMNIVGPRPERPSIFENLRENITEYPLRQRARPGITGLAQINQQYDACMDDVRQKVNYDLEYLRRQGVAEDVRIMLRTLPVMIGQKLGW